MDVKRGQHRRDTHGTYRVMVVAEGYAMVRRKGCAPFLRRVKEIEANDPLLAISSPTPPDPDHA